MLVVLYSHNEEAALFRDLDADLRRNGHTVRYRAVKYKIPEACDVAYTLPRHESIVREMFQGRPGVRVKVYDGTRKASETVLPPPGKNTPKEETQANGEVAEGQGSGQGTSTGEVQGGSEGQEGSGSGFHTEVQVQSFGQSRARKAEGRRPWEGSGSEGQQSEEVTIPISHNPNPKNAD